MTEALRFFKTYEIWLYLLLGLTALFYVRKFIIAWEELRGAAFGLERESAQGRVNHAALIIMLLLALVVGEFALVTFIAPAVPQANPLKTPTVDLLATATATLPTVNETPSSPETTATLAPMSGETCTPGQSTFSEPQNGSEVSGNVTIKGTATIENFGFYKYEVARPGDAIWLTIQAGRSPVVENELGQWDTTILPSGDYLLRLVVTDNQGAALPACVIRVRVNNPSEP